MSDSLEQIAAKVEDQIRRMSQTSKNWPHDWAVLRIDIQELVSAAHASGRAEGRAALEALRKIRGHTSYQAPTLELLQGLLASIERIADAALAAASPATETEP